MGAVFFKGFFHFQRGFLLRKYQGHKAQKGEEAKHVGRLVWVEVFYRRKEFFVRKTCHQIMTDVF